MRAAFVLITVATALAASSATGSSSGASVGSRWIAFHADARGSGDLYLDTEDGSRRRRLTRLFGQVPTAAWSPDGTRLALLARPAGVIDVYVIGVNGRGLRRLTHDEGDHFGDVSWSPDGRRLAFTCCGEREQAIYTIGADGSGRMRLADNAGQPVWSRDGERIAFLSFRDGNPELYSMKTDGSDQTRLTSGPAEDVDPAWSPDGRRIAFTSKRDGKAQIYVMDADGSHQRRLVRDRWSDQRPAWSPSGRQIVFTSFRNRDPNLLGIGNAEILVANVGQSRVRNLTRTPFWEGEPAWAPDGRQIAFAIRRDFGPGGRFRVGVMRSDGTGERLLPPVPGEGSPVGLANSCCPAWQP
jgi:Tol biopolymer transport system component